MRGKRSGSLRSALHTGVSLHLLSYSMEMQGLFGHTRLLQLHASCSDSRVPQAQKQKLTHTATSAMTSVVLPYSFLLLSDHRDSWFPLDQCHKNFRTSQICIAFSLSGIASLRRVAFLMRLCSNFLHWGNCLCSFGSAGTCH